MKKMILVGSCALIFILSACSKKDDPKPVKTDLEVVVGAIAGKTWELKSAAITAKTGEVYNYKGDCDFSEFPATPQGNKPLVAQLLDYTFTFGVPVGSNKDYGVITWINNCSTSSGNNMIYTISQSDSKFRMDITGSYNAKLEFVTDIKNIGNSEISLKRLSFPNDDATEVILTFSVK